MIVVNNNKISINNNNNNNKIQIQMIVRIIIIAILHIIKLTCLIKQPILINKNNIKIMGYQVI